MKTTPEAAERCKRQTMRDQLAEVREQLERDTARKHAKARKILNDDQSDSYAAFEPDPLDFPSIDWRYGERSE